MTRVWWGGDGEMGDGRVTSDMCVCIELGMIEMADRSAFD